MDSSSDRLPFPRRRFGLFLFVFLVPFVVLTALAVRTLNQDRELAVRREEDARRQLAAAIRQEFLSRLENIRLRALSASADVRGDARAIDPGSLADPADAVILVARIENRWLVLPWENRPAAADGRRILAGEPFAGFVSHGETEELVRQQPAAAAAFYRRALSAARHPLQIASAELLAARALGKAGQDADALEYTRRTMRHPLSLVDDVGLPFALYASRRVVDLKALDIEDARTALAVARQTAASPAMSPPAVHMAASIVSTLQSEETPEIKADASAVQAIVAAQIARGEQALALQQTFPALARQFPAGAATGSDPFWLPFGQGPWLVGLTAAINGRQQFLIAVDALKVFDRLESAERCASAGGCRLALAADGGPDNSSYSLGPALPGLTLARVTVSAEAGQRTRSNRGFYIAALSLVLMLAAFGAYLLWRDVRRELRVAELRSQFVSSVSHELKTPLTAIRMFAETLRMGRPAEPALRDEYLDIIVNESERLTRLLNNVLDFSRIESGRKTYQFAPHRLDAIVRTAARAMQYPLARQGFELLVDVDETIPPVQCDPDALEQAILNLLANALKYSADARTIELRLARDGASAVISVRDWGIGIEPTDQRRIFDKFYRVTRPENRLIPGTGLGLTLVDHIVRSHHGHVGVDSAPGGGSTFRIDLPITEQGPVPDEHDDEELAPGRAAGSEA